MLSPTTKKIVSRTIIAARLRAARYTRQARGRDLVRFLLSFRWSPGSTAATRTWWRLLHNTEKLADPTRFERSTSAFGEWGKILPDQAMTLAVFDRLVHHATIFEMNAESYRRRAALERKRGSG